MIKFVRLKADDTSEVVSVLQTVRDQMENKEWYVIDNYDYYFHYLQDGHGVGYKAVDMDTDKTLGLFVAVITDKKELHLGYDCGLDEDQIKKEAIMDTVAVLPEARGQNLQFLLMHAVEEKLREMGYRYLTATVHPDNPYSLRNALKRNYKIMTTKEKYGGYLRHILLKNLEEGKNE